jgi:ribulose-5-phosphate 4-epimerase/fuculose-1-phosphate aldolase
MNEADQRKQLVELARSLFDRGYSVGSAGNLSVRLDDQTILATPTGSSFGRLDAGQLSHLTIDGELLGGKPPSKEVKFHLELYRGDDDCKSVVHLHATWTTLLSCRKLEPGEPLFRVMTPYVVMKVGKLELIPYLKPGSPEIADHMRKWAGKRKAFLLANHGSVVTGKSLAEAVDAAEELEETAKLAYLSERMDMRYLTTEEIKELQN